MKKKRVYQRPECVLIRFNNGLHLLAGMSHDAEWEDLVEHDEDWGI